MKVITKHPTYPRHVVRRAAAWAAKQIGMESKHLKRITVEVGYRRSRHGGGWGGWYRHGRRLAQVLLSPVPLTYPASMANNISERESGRDANDEWELFVAILAHELEHARAYAVAATWQDHARLNHEPRVRAVDWRVLLTFRDHREALLAEWTREPAARERKPVPSVVERRAARAADLLAKWERRLRLAKTKVTKYRRRVGYYEKAGKKG